MSPQLPPGSCAQCGSGLGEVYTSLPLSPSKSAAEALEVGASEANRAESWGVGTALLSGVAFLITMMWG